LKAVHEHASAGYRKSHVLFLHYFNYPLLVLVMLRDCCI